MDISKEVKEAVKTLIEEVVSDVEINLTGVILIEKDDAYYLRTVFEYFITGHHRIPSPTPKEVNKLAKEGSVAAELLIKYWPEIYDVKEPIKVGDKVTCRDEIDGEVKFIDDSYAFVLWSDNNRSLIPVEELTRV